MITDFQRLKYRSRQVIFSEKALKRFRHHGIRRNHIRFTVKKRKLYFLFLLESANQRILFVLNIFADHIGRLVIHILPDQKTAGQIETLACFSEDIYRQLRKTLIRFQHTHNFRHCLRAMQLMLHFILGFTTLLHCILCDQLIDLYLKQLCRQTCQKFSGSIETLLCCRHHIFRQFNSLRNGIPEDSDHNPDNFHFLFQTCCNTAHLNACLPHLLLQHCFYPIMLCPHDQTHICLLIHKRMKKR